jgi:hypothetical protein
MSIHVVVSDVHVMPPAKIILSLSGGWRGHRLCILCCHTIFPINHVMAPLEALGVILKLPEGI